MTQMESPKRKMQKKNDYQRHKLFRKIKRRRKAQAKADQQVAMKQLRKKLKLPNNHLNNLEVGKYIGAEPFDIQYDLPFHIQDHKINIGLGRTPTPLENKIYPQLLQFHNSGKDINIKPSKRGTFTKAAKQHGMSVQGFANRVLRNPSKYSAAMRKKANFARNASKWNK